MKVGIHLDRYNQISPFLKIYFEILKFNSIDVKGLNSGHPDFFKQLSDLDAFIYRWLHYDYDRQIAHTIIPVIENELHIKCFPNLRTCWHYDDKIRQYYLSESNGLPMTGCHIFWDKSEALKWLADAQLPLVFKLKGGAGSQNVILVKSKNQGAKLIHKIFGSGFKGFQFSAGSTFMNDFNVTKLFKQYMWHLKMYAKGQPVETAYSPQKNYAIFQKFLPENDFDTRVTVIGNRAFAFRRFNRKNDFRSSGSGLIDYDSNKIDLNHIKTAFETSKKMNFQCMAYDFLYNEQGKSEFCEMSYTFADKNVYYCKGHWDDQLNWHEGHLWPQFCQLQDLLNLPGLKQPML